MKSQHDRVPQCVKLLPLGLVVLLALAGLGGAALAQENQVLMSVELPVEAIEEEGEEFEVNIVVDNVTNLAGFQFSLEYDSSIIEYKSVKEGSFLGSSGREVMCPDPFTEPGDLRFSCVTLGPPVSLGGTAGADGFGVLATITFSLLGGGETPLDLTEDSKLVAAEIDEQGVPIEFETAVQGASLDVKSPGGGFAWALWGPIIGVIAVVILSALAYLVMRMRRAPESGPPAGP